MPRGGQPPRRSLGQRIVGALCLLYAAGMAGYFVVRTLLVQWPAPLLLLGYATPYLFAPLVPLLLLALLARSRAGVAGCLLVLALFLADYGELFLPRLGPGVPPGARRLVAMAYNLGPSVSTPARLVAAIAAEDADVVAAEEVYPAAARALRTDLESRYPYAILEPGRHETGLLSRYPIREQEWFRPAGFGREALHATLDAGGRPLEVFVIHPLPPGIAWLRTTHMPIGLYEGGLDRQMADVAARAGALSGPVLVLGDFNMSDQTRAYSALTSRLRDAYREAGSGFGFTFPVGLRLDGQVVPGPLVRIDYIFHSAALRATRAHVGCRGSSDHCYVVADLYAVGGD